MHLFTAINRDGELFIWPIRILDPNSYGASWSTSALEAAKQAETEWVRRTGIDKKQGVYIFGSAVAQHDEPAWPKMSFGDILETAFRDAFINSPDHPVLKKLRGEL
jgi:hypothetical protein